MVCLVLFFVFLLDLHWSLVFAVGTVLLVAVEVVFLHREFNYGDIDALSQHFVVLFSVPHSASMYEEQVRKIINPMA